VRPTTRAMLIAPQLAVRAPRSRAAMPLHGPLAAAPARARLGSQMGGGGAELTSTGEGGSRRWPAAELRVSIGGGQTYLVLGGRGQRGRR